MGEREGLELIGQGDAQSHGLRQGQGLGARALRERREEVQTTNQNLERAERPCQRGQGRGSRQGDFVRHKVERGTMMHSEGPGNLVGSRPPHWRWPVCLWGAESVFLLGASFFSLGHFSPPTAWLRRPKAPR